MTNKKSDKEKVTYYSTEIDASNNEEPGEDFCYKVVRENFYNGRFKGKNLPFDAYQDLNYGLLLKTSYDVNNKRLQQSVRQGFKKYNGRLKRGYRSCSKRLTENNHFFDQIYLEYLGDKYPINLKLRENVKYNELTVDDNVINIHYDKDEIKSLTNSYQQEDMIIELIKDNMQTISKREIKDKVKKYSQILDVDIGRATVKQNMYKGFSNCTNKGNLTFTWNVIRLPEKLIDFLVVKGLAQAKLKKSANGGSDFSSTKLYAHMREHIDDPEAKDKLIGNISCNKFFFHENFINNSGRK